MTGRDAGIDEDRTLRLDRIAGARALPGSFEPPAGVDPAERVLSGLATAPYRHRVSLRLQGPAEQIRTRLPASVATLEELPPPAGTGGEAPPWFRAELRVEDLGWLPPLLASLDLPFVIEEPDELRDLTLALAGRLAARARG